MSRVTVPLLVVACLFLPSAVRASCGAANCPIDVHTSERLVQGDLRVDFAREYINQNEPKVGRKNASVGQIPGHHDERYTLSVTERFGIEAALTDRWSVQAIVPFVHREHQHVHHHHGTDITQSWNFDGVGDVTLLNRFIVLRSEAGPDFAVTAGAVLPTGRDGVTNEAGDQAEVPIQPGKGAVSLIAGFSSVWNAAATTLNGKAARLPVFASTTYQWNREGTHDYRIGDQWLVHIGATYPLFPRVGWLNQLNLRVDARDERGNTFEEIDKTGGTYLFYSPGLQLLMTDNLVSWAYVQIPLYQRVNRIQLTSDYNLIFGASYRFSVL